MSLKASLKKVRDAYITHQVSRLPLPEFTPSRLCRCQVTFSGRVQKVGFRQEVRELALRLGLTGFCKNLESGDVVAQLQGPDAKIQFLLSFMESLKRIKIRHKTVEEIPLVPDETGFLRL